MMNTIKILSVVFGAVVISDVSASGKFLDFFKSAANKVKSVVSRNKDNALVSAVNTIGGTAIAVGTVVATQKIQAAASTTIQPYVANVVNGANTLRQNINNQINAVRAREVQIQQQEAAISSQISTATQVQQQQQIAQLEQEKQQLATIDAAYVGAYQQLGNLIILAQCGDLQRIVNEVPLLINQIQTALLNTPLRDEAANFVNQSVNQLTQEAATEINNQNAALQQQYLPQS
jgi:hypothetical protein